MTSESKKPKISKRYVMLVLYKNHKNEVAWRYVQPLGKDQVAEKSAQVEFGSPYHPNEWIMRVWDLGKGAERSYALSGIIWCAPLSKPVPSPLTLTYGDPPSPPDVT